jgi:hypothetical protein
MDENVVDPLDDAMAVHPEIAPIAVVPIAIDPDAARADWSLLLDHDGRRRRRRLLLRGGGWRGLLNHDDRLTLDLLRLALLGFDDRVVCRSWRLGRLARALVHIAIMPRSGRAVATRALVALRSGSYSAESDHRKREQRLDSWKRNHASFLACISAEAFRHPDIMQQAQPARQRGRKVLGLPRSKWAHTT